MNEQQVINLFNKIKSAKPGTKWTLEKLKEKLKTKETRKEFYENETYKTYLTSLGISLGDTLQEFESKYGLQKTTNDNTNNSTNKPKPNTTPVILTPQDIWAGKVVEQGMEGDIVKLIQDQLKKKEFLEITTTTRLFGTLTKKAVVNFQNANGIPVTGKVDSVTWNKLFAGTNYEEKKQVDNQTNQSVQKPITTQPKENPKVGPQVKRAGSIKEQVAVKQSDPKKSFLTKSIKTKDNQGLSCIDKHVKKYNFKEHPEYRNLIVDLEDGNPALVYIGTNPKNKQEENYYIVSDGTKLTGIFQSGFEIDIEECQNQSLDLGVFGNLSEKQKQYIQYNVTPQSGYKIGVTPGEEEYYDKIDIVNAFKTASDYFNPNKYFIYKRKGYKVQNRDEEFYNQIENVINRLGWTYKKPNIDTEAYSTKTDIRIKFPKYSELFPNGLAIYYTGTTRSANEIKIVSDLVTNIQKQDAIDGKVCRDAVNVLYDAKQNYDKDIIYFSGDTELEIVRQYVQRCQKNYEKNLFGRILGTAKKKYDELMSRKHYPNGVMKFNLAEQKGSLDYLIKTKLMEMKRKKEDGLIS